MKFELNFIDLKSPFTVHKLIAWKTSESEEDSETSAEDKSPRPDFHRIIET